MNKYDQESNFDILSGEVNKKFKFEPPLYLQRYNYVLNLLKDYNCKTYMDVGCAECNLLRYAKNSTDLKLNLIIGVDVDGEVLTNSEEKFTLLYDLVQQRDSPLDIYLINGDISVPSKYFLEKVSYQNMVLDFVSLVEVIEHMHPDVLKNTVNTIFEKIKPRIVVITTPNCEFNVVFEDDEENSSSPKERLNKVNSEQTDAKRPKKFRHWDHKFEWTRKEFQDWCQNDILNVYDDYSLLKFDGLGEPPLGYENCGFCTQIAVLFRNDKFEQDMTVFQNKFELYLKEKKNLYLKNREIQFSCNNPGLKLIQEPFFDRDLFEKFYVLESVLREFKLTFSMSYPFENYDFETEIDSRKALLREIDSITKFLTASYRGFGSFNESRINDEEKVKLENKISKDDDTIRFACLSKILEFPVLKKFKYSNEKIIEIMKENNYRFTLDNNYVMISQEQSSDEEDESSEYIDDIYKSEAFDKSQDHFSEEDWH